MYNKFRDVLGRVKNLIISKNAGSWYISVEAINIKNMSNSAKGNATKYGKIKIWIK
jgi:hypothetical protein